MQFKETSAKKSAFESASFFHGAVRPPAFVDRRIILGDCNQQYWQLFVRGHIEIFVAFSVYGRQKKLFHGRADANQNRK